MSPNQGLVNHAVAPTLQNARLDGYHFALNIAREIIANAPLANQQAKKSICNSMQCSVEDALEMEKKCYNVVLNSLDRNEGLLAFSEKRKPIFTGK